ncbi:MAG: polyphosphate kinase 1, partial [Polyangiaceae bacterium]|nr:polyphosphate kinase 1 [Polyangiaceae bacterium]
MNTSSKHLSRLNLPDQIPHRPAGTGVKDPQMYINRELSWLEFNARVLAEAESDKVPLFERLKFLTIFSSNLDEFFMVRAAGLQAQLHNGIHDIPPDGATAEEQLTAISKRAHELCQWQMKIWNQLVGPALRDEAGLGVFSPEELPEEVREELDQRFEQDIFPVLTPIAIDPAHPFPHLRNKSLNVGFIFQQDTAGEPTFGLVQLPGSLPRLVPVECPGLRRAFVPLEALIFRHARRLFPHVTPQNHFVFRVTRNFDLELDEDEGEDLLLAIQAELRRRERGHAVRLEIAGQIPEEALDWLCAELGIEERRDLYRVNGPLRLEHFGALTKKDDRKEFVDGAFSPLYVPPLRDSEDLFRTIRKEDILLHHPYESFEAVIDFITKAAEDPNVLAIKQTLYRTGGESPLVRALQRAAELGKQVTAVVELKARFDEASNIQWARTLERSGVNVMYGLLGLKTHAKVLLVVRKEGSRLRRYVHLATGNYNQQTARLYEDLSLFTANEEIGEDATSLFNLLTGYSAPERWNHLLVAPLGLHEATLGLIHREKLHAEAGRPARIIAKMNQLVDPDVIQALYQASQAGVQVDLLIRGICCLRPEVPEVSDNIRVHAVVDRFLEHARVFYFENGGDSVVYCGSADWMPRNFRRRVETTFPLLSPQLKERMKNEILDLMISDTVKGWTLDADGRYNRVKAKKNVAVR